MIDWIKSLVSFQRWKHRKQFYNNTLTATSLPPAYHDLDFKMFRAIMDEMVKFVDVELRMITDNPLEYLANVCQETNEEWVGEGEKVTLTSNAEAALELLRIYDWYVVTYKNRKSTSEASGVAEYYRLHPRAAKHFMNPLPPELAAMYDEMNRIEKEYYQEETDMLIRLMKIRGFLWV